VDDVAAAHAELTAKGVNITAPPKDHGVCQVIELLDPDGNVVLLHHRTDDTFGR
jgi:predicted enzyme related to lactoylglutathione lyase